MKKNQNFLRFASLTYFKFINLATGIFFLLPHFNAEYSIKLPQKMYKKGRGYSQAIANIGLNAYLRDFCSHLSQKFLENFSSGN